MSQFYLILSAHRTKFVFKIILIIMVKENYFLIECCPEIFYYALLNLYTIDTTIRIRWKTKLCTKFI